MSLAQLSKLPAVARVDAEGRLVSADPQLLDLVRRAGGEVGAALPVPEIAAIVRLARRLGIAIARSVMVADGDDDLELWVRAEPEGEGVTIGASGWHVRAPWRGEPIAQRDALDFAATEGDWGWETDAVLRVTHIAIEAGPRYGFDAEAMLGEPLVRLFALSEDVNGEFPILSAAAGQKRFNGQFATVRANGRPVRLSAVPRIDDRGRFAGFVGAAHMGEAPETAPELPGGFAAQLEKALRLPLERIVANAGSMSAGIDGSLGESYAGYADDIAVAGRHLLGLVTDLADLEAIERDDFAMVAEEIDLADIARRAAGLLGVRASEREARIDRPAIGETLPATGDFRRALQVLVNLIGNAVRYSPSGGMVWVRTEREGGQACVIVADQGKGIAPEDHEMIFDKFGRVDPGEPGGSGLGLYISRRLARSMGGDITVDSAAGQGARFIFTLPAR